MAEELKNKDSENTVPETKNKDGGKNEESVTAEQIQEMLKVAKEEARKEEKNKLYSDLKKTEKKISELSGLYEQIKKERDEKDAQLKAEKEANMTLEEKFETMKAKSEEAFAGIGQSIDEKFKAHEQIVGDLKAQLSKSQLDAFKERRLRELTENDIGFIPELVVGSTPEEIDQSIENSVKRMKELAEKAIGKKIDGESFRFPKATTPNSPPSTEDEVLTEVSKLRPTNEKDFYSRLKALGAKNTEDHAKLTEDRERIKAELRRKWEASQS